MKSVKLTEATLRLFNAVFESNATKYNQKPVEDNDFIINGLVIDPRITLSADTKAAILGICGLSGAKANSAFHKSWQIVRDSSMEVLVAQQILHYFTTYGYQALGIYSDDTIYIPAEKLDIPAIMAWSLKDTFALTVIKAMTESQIADAVLDLGASGIALSQETLDDIMIVIEAIELPPIHFVLDRITNRELLTRLYDHFNIAPTKPEEWLRYIVAKITGETLLIKNSALIEKLRAANSGVLDLLLLNAPKDLASIFYRYKVLFLAMKQASINKNFFNRLRKAAPAQHQPLPVDYLNTVTEQIKKGTLNLIALNGVLEKATIWRKVRLAYALSHRLQAGDSIVYKVRNGRGWITDFDWPQKAIPLTKKALKMTVKSIASSLESNVSDKVIYIPDNIRYALPATEKQFTGNFPTGTYVVVPKDMIVGIHWLNNEPEGILRWGYGTVDLDLSATSIEGKIGWDSKYRNEAQTVLFSGDITSAPKPDGASELFHFSADIVQPHMISVNYYNRPDDGETDCKLFVATAARDLIERNLMVDQNRIIATANIRITQKQTVLGLVVNVGTENRFYFSNVAIGNSITMQTNEQVHKARRFLLHSMVGSLSFAKILKIAGALVVNEVPEEGEYIDLSPEKLTKSTIIDLLKEN